MISLSPLLSHLLLQVKESDKWQCYMCSSDKSGVGLMKKREDWDKKLHDLFLNDNEIDFVRDMQA